MDICQYSVRPPHLPLAHIPQPRVGLPCIPPWQLDEPALWVGYLSWLHLYSIAAWLNEVPITLTPITATWAGLRHLRKQIPKDDSLRNQLTPNYTVGCKRIIVSNEYYPTMALPHVKLHTDKIVEVKADGIRTADGGSQKIDVINAKFIYIFNNSESRS